MCVCVCVCTGICTSWYTLRAVRGGEYTCTCTCSTNKYVCVEEIEVNGVAAVHVLYLVVNIHVYTCSTRVYSRSPELRKLWGMGVVINYTVYTT